MRFSAAWASPRNPRPWRYIVIHHSATDAGNAGTFDLQHRRRGWDELGYHFGIDNGQGAKIVMQGPKVDVNDGALVVQ